METRITPTDPQASKAFYRKESLRIREKAGKRGKGPVGEGPPRLWPVGFKVKFQASWLQPAVFVSLGVCFPQERLRNVCQAFICIFQGTGGSLILSGG